MGILDSIKNREWTKGSTKGFYFGSTEAEAENNEDLSLVNYFSDYLEILEQLEKGKFIFIGRKGVGKSAIAKFIKDTSDSSDNSNASLLRINDFELEKVIQNFDDNNNNKEAVLLEWLILVNIVKLIIRNDSGTYTKEFGKLKDFIDRNSGIVNIDKFQIDSINHQNGGEVKFDVLSHAFGAIIKKYFDVKTTKAPFYKFIPPLREIVETVLNFSVVKDSEFWILFDDLDINYSIHNERDNDKIIELIRLAKKYNNEVFKGVNAKILIFLRDDIRQNIVTKYADSAKIFSSYEIYINWYNNESFKESENKIALKRFINRRIELNFINKNLKFDNKDPWYTLFERDNYNPNVTPYKSSFKYITDFTFFRPRDIITFFTIIGDNNYIYPLDKRTVKLVLAKYIQINILEIKSELSLYFTDCEKSSIFEVILPFLADNSNVTFSELLKKIYSCSFRMPPKEVLEILNRYSIIVHKDEDGLLYFNYRENPEIDRLDKDTITFSLPKCIYHYYKKIVY